MIIFIKIIMKNGFFTSLPYFTPLPYFIYIFNFNHYLKLSKKLFLETTEAYLFFLVLFITYLLYLLLFNQVFKSLLNFIESKLLELLFYYITKLLFIIRWQYR
jgi:hypothetical protein